MTHLAEWWPVFAQVVGIVIIAVGFGLLVTWAGVVVGGIGVLAIGVAAELQLVARPSGEITERQ